MSDQDHDPPALPTEITPDDALPPSTRRALELAGAWSDLDWDEFITWLDEVRHASPPSPPIEDDW